MEHNYVNEPERYIVSDDIINTPDGIRKQQELLHKQNLQYNKHNQPNSEKYVDKHVHIGNNNMFTGSSNRNIPHNYQNINNNSQQNSSTQINNHYKHDPYMAYVEKHGISHDSINNIIRTKTHYYNVDSSHRKKIPSIVTDDNIMLGNNPLSISENSYNMTITHTGHTFQINDKIMISGIKKKQIKLRSIVNSNVALEFINGKSYVVIHYAHGINNGTYDVSDLYVEINDFLGNTSNGTFFDNISTNSINNIHNISILNPDDNSFDINKFYIYLPNTYFGTSNYEQFNFTLIFYYTGGIPINIINNDYPINNDNLYGFHSIIETTTNTYTIKLSKVAGKTMSFGDNFVSVKKLNEIISSYQNPNKYEIELEKTFYNVIGVKLISSEFPNIENIVGTITINDQNNNLYWKNYDDGDYLYNILVPPGNYTSTELQDIIKSLCYDTPRINYEHDLLLDNVVAYTNHNNISVDINTYNNIVTFTSFKQSNIIKPFTSISPIINSDPLQDPTTPITHYTLTITHKSHNLLSGDEITIYGSISHMGIPSSILNGTYTIKEILSNDMYTISLPPFNLENERTYTNGGNAVIINSKNLIKLYFDRTDTIGSTLGFQNVGDENSVTDYNNIIKNTDKYHVSTQYDVVGNINTITNNHISFIRNNYMLMVCSQLNSIYSTGPIKKIFSKILFNNADSNNKIIFNTFIHTPITFFDPISELSKLNLSFYLPNGELINFNNMEHSFTLEITTIDEHPKDTHIYTKTGKSYYG